MSGNLNKREPFSRIKGMWIFAMFDLPVYNKAKRKEYSRFRKLLLCEGFSMLQYSVYARYCLSREKSAVFCKRIQGHLPSDGQVRLMHITDKQFSEMLVYYGRKRKKPEKKPEQLLLL